MELPSCLNSYLTMVNLFLRLKIGLTPYLFGVLLIGLCSYVLYFHRKTSKFISSIVLRKFIYWSAILLSVVAVFIFIHAISFFPDPPHQYKLDIPDLPQGTFGFRAWGTRVRVSNVNITLTPSRVIPFRPQQGSSWRHVWFESDKHEGNLSPTAVPDGSDAVILQNSGIIYAAPESSMKYGRIAATIEFKEITPTIKYPSFQFCFRIPIAKTSSKVLSQYGSALPGLSPQSDDYIALEVFPRHIWWSKCWLPAKSKQPDYYGDYYERLWEITKAGLFNLQVKQQYRLIAEIANDGSATIRIISRDGIAVPLYDGKIVTLNKGS